MNCANCGEPIRLAFVGSNGEYVWDHINNGHHTVCNWTEKMEPTDVVATPRRVSTRWHATDEFGNLDTMIGMVGR